MAKRICPEVINFINFTLVSLLSLPMTELPDTRTDNGMSEVQLRATAVKDIPSKISFSLLYTKNVDEEQLKLQLFGMAVELIDVSSNIWKSSIALPELFHPTHAILTSISKKKLISTLPISLQVTPSIAMLN
jgi:Nop14-like family